MRKLVLIIALLFLAGCTTTKGPKDYIWGYTYSPPKYVPTIAEIQTEVDGLYWQGLNFVNAHPEKQFLWNRDIMPVVNSIRINLLNECGMSHPLGIEHVQNQVRNLRIYLFNQGIPILQ